MAIVAWEHPHGDSANRSFADVVTAPAGAGSLSVPGLGSFAPGSGPVIAPDGTVYLGTSEGRLIALRANGSELWAAQLPALQGIVSSPVVGGDGSTYVVGLTLPVRDHREGSTVTVYRAWLHKFSRSGERLWDIPFPDKRNTSLPSYGPRLTGPPNVWRSGGEEYVMVPAVYRNYGREFYVIAFPAQGGSPLDARVSFIPDEITGTGFPWDVPDWWPFNTYTHGVPYVPDIGLPPVAIYTYPGGGALGDGVRSRPRRGRADVRSRARLSGMVPGAGRGPGDALRSKRASRCTYRGWNRHGRGRFRWDQPSAVGAGESG